MSIDFLYSAILRSSFGLSMGAIWQHLSVELSSLKASNKEKTDIFFEVLKRLMLEGHLRLALDGKYLSGSVSEQIDIIKLSWPSCPAEDDLDGFGFWVLTAAPAGVVWVTPGGEEVWA